MPSSCSGTGNWPSWLPWRCLVLISSKLFLVTTWCDCNTQENRVAHQGCALGATALGECRCPQHDVLTCFLWHDSVWTSQHCQLRIQQHGWTFSCLALLPGDPHSLLTAHWHLADQPRTRWSVRETYKLVWYTLKTPKTTQRTTEYNHSVTLPCSSCCFVHWYCKHTTTVVLSGIWRPQPFSTLRIVYRDIRNSSVRRNAFSKHWSSFCPAAEPADKWGRTEGEPERNEPVNGCAEVVHTHDSFFSNYTLTTSGKPIAINMHFVMNGKTSPNTIESERVHRCTLYNLEKISIACNFSFPRFNVTVCNIMIRRKWHIFSIPELK